MKSRIIVLFALLLLSTATAAAPRAVVDLDFLAGDWVLTDPSGKEVGTSHVDVPLPGALVHEVRTDSSGVIPVWFVRSERLGGWSQLFPGPKGDLREFSPVSTSEWPLVLGGKFVLQDGRAAEFRLTLTHESDQASHRVLRMSLDGGKSWQDVFDYQYRRVVR